MRPRALPVRPQIRHDHAKAFTRDPLGMAELDPIHLRIGEQAVQQDDRPALAKFVIG